MFQDKIEAITRNKNDSRFTAFLFLEAMVDCSLKEINRVIPAKKENLDKNQDFLVAP